MASPPSSAAAGAAVAASALSGLIEILALRLPVPEESARATVATAGRIAQIAAPACARPMMLRQSQLS